MLNCLNSKCLNFTFIELRKRKLTKMSKILLFISPIFDSLVYQIKKYPPQYINFVFSANTLETVDTEVFKIETKKKSLLKKV